MGNELRRCLVGIRSANLFFRLIVKVLFIHDESAPDRIVGALKKEFLSGPGAQPHSVFMERKELRMKDHAGILRKLHLSFAIEKKPAGLSDAFDDGGNSFKGHRIGEKALEPEKNGLIGMVAVPCQRKRAVDIRPYAGCALEKTLLSKVFAESFTRSHRTDGMRARRTDADFEDVEGTDHENCLG